MLANLSQIITLNKINVQQVDKSFLWFFCCPTESSISLTFELLLDVKNERKKEKNFIEQ